MLGVGALGFDSLDCGGGGAGGSALRLPTCPHPQFLHHHPLPPSQPLPPSHPLPPTPQPPQGHAAIPHLARDPVVAAAAIVGALQALVSRETSPFASAVLSVTRLQGGEAYNVIPGEWCGWVAGWVAGWWLGGTRRGREARPPARPRPPPPRSPAGPPVHACRHGTDRGDHAIDKRRGHARAAAAGGGGGRIHSRRAWVHRCGGLDAGVWGGGGWGVGGVH